MVWDELEEALEKNETIIGRISGKVKGGFTVDIKDVRAFCRARWSTSVRCATRVPGRQETGIQAHQARSQAQQRDGFTSRGGRERAFGEREQLLEKLVEGAVLKGVVKNLTDYGAFVDLGGIDGCCTSPHGWKRVRHPSEVVEVGAELDVRVLKYDRSATASASASAAGRGSVGQHRPSLPSKHRVIGKVSNVTDYGAFVEIEPGVEGCERVRDGWTNKNVNPSKVVQVGDELEVMVRMSMRSVAASRWASSRSPAIRGRRLPRSTRRTTRCRARSSRSRLRHLHRPGRRYRWPHPPVRHQLELAGEDIARNYKKGDTLEAVVLAVDPEPRAHQPGREADGAGSVRPVRGVEQTKGSLVKGTVKEVGRKGATIDLGEGVEGYLRRARHRQGAHRRRHQHLKVGDEWKRASSAWTARPHDAAVDQGQGRSRGAGSHERLQPLRSRCLSGTTKLGALLREQLNSKAE